MSIQVTVALNFICLYLEGFCLGWTVHWLSLYRNVSIVFISVKYWRWEWMHEHVPVICLCTSYWEIASLFRDDVIKLKIFRVTGLLCGNSPITGEFSAQRQVTGSFDVFFDLRLNQQLSNQWRRRRFQTPLWCHCNAKTPWYLAIYCIHLRGECIPNNINGGLLL